MSILRDEIRDFKLLKHIKLLVTDSNTWKVSVCQGTPFSRSISTLSPESLSGVTSFSGTHQQLQALPHLHSSSKSVTFRDPVETREVSSITVASLLRNITSLTELKVSFTLHSMYDSGNLLRSLVQACPNLRHLDLTCEHKLFIWQVFQIRNCLCPSLIIPLGHIYQGHPRPSETPHLLSEYRQISR